MRADTGGSLEPDADPAFGVDFEKSERVGVDSLDEAWLALDRREEVLPMV